MAHVVFTWEIGAGFGHLVPMAALGGRLSALGHRVAAVIPSAKQGRQRLEALGIQVVDAPASQPPARGFPLSVNYTANLLRNGYWHPGASAQRIGDWRALLTNLKPDLLVCEHAPAALLASRDAGYPRVALGNGFTLPPRTEPMPSLQPWFPVPLQHLREIDQTFLDAVNPLLEGMGLPPLDRVDALYDGAHRWLCIEPELDHYPLRADEAYLGAIEPPAALVSATPPPMDDPEVFVYMSAHNRFLIPVLEALRQRGIKTLAYIAGAACRVSANYPASPSLHYLNELVDLNRIAARCRLVITHGGTLTAAQVLKRGRRLLICPQDLEKALLARRLADRKLAQGLNWFAPASPVGEALDQALCAKAEPEHLAAFRRRHERLSSDDILSGLSRQAESLLGHPLH